MTFIDRSLDMIRKWSIFLLLSAALCVASAGMVAVAAEPQPAAESPDTSGEGGKSKLYEAIQGYLESFRGKQPKDVKKPQPPAPPRFDPARVQPSDPKEEQHRSTLRTELTRAESLIQRGEWDLAVGSLERAVEAASRLNVGDELTKLRDMLAEARSKASTVSGSDQFKYGEMVNSAGMRLVLVPAGKFTMGSSGAETRAVENEWVVQREMLQPEEPAHAVHITRPFFIGKYEVTVRQFRQFVDETGYRTVAEKQGWGWAYDEKARHWNKKQGASWRSPGTKTGDDYPVTLVTYQDAEAFCKWLTAKERRTYFLPTEAQWEYAARGGKEGERYPWGNDYPDGRKLNLADRRSPVPWADRTLDDGNAGPAPVGGYVPNGYYLYDVAGNVWELCSDIYDAKEYEGADKKSIADPAGPARGKTRVVRGGNWAFGAGLARCAFRFGLAPDVPLDITGFRIAALAGESEALARRSDDNKRASSPANLDANQLIEEVKRLTESGRRAEARRLVDQFRGAAANKGAAGGDSSDLMANVLDAMIDITKDKSLQSFINSLDITMVRIPAGSFVMGSSDIDIAWAMATLAQEQPVNLENELPFHKVRISRPFFIGATEVTVGQFRRFVEETGYVTDAEEAGGGQVFNETDNTFEFKAGTNWKNPGWTVEDSQPIAMVSYYDAQAFCDWLAAKEKLPYKLPTEAQWEYACRGGLPMAHFPWGDTLPDGRKANYADKSTSFRWRDRYADDGYKHVAPVGTYEANGYGLYDMAGNVLEWVRDHYGEDYYRYAPEVDPEGPGHGENRVMKGGEWCFGAVNLRCAFRGWSRPDLAFYNSGFRLAIDLASPRRPFHFANDFLTKQWVPGQDEREVAGAVAKDKERRSALEASRRRSATAVRSTPAPAQVVRGVMVLDLSPRSDARRAGLTKGDVIIAYDGTRDLSSEKLLTLAGEAKKKRIRPELTFVRDGYEHTVQVDPGILGITMLDTRLTGPFRKHEPEPARRQQPERQPEKKDGKPLDWT